MSKKTTKQFIIESQNIFDKYDYSEVDYINNKTKVEIVCKKHGSFWKTPNHHLKGQGCPECSSTKKTLGRFISESNKVHNYKYIYSKSIYKNALSKIEIICPKHGSFFQRTEAHLRGQGCSKCNFESQNKTTKEFIVDAIKVHGNKYDYSKVNYKNNYTKVKIVCKKHGCFLQISNSHLNGRGCPNCNTSKGELKIKKYLDSYNINYIQQKTFKDCKYKRFLKFDFYLPEENVCIEYDGIQHFQPIKYFGGEKAFNKTKIRDNIKNNYCNEKNIQLIRIKYNQRKIGDKIWL